MGRHSAPELPEPRAPYEDEWAGEPGNVGTTVVKRIPMPARPTPDERQRYVDRRRLDELAER